MYKLFQVKHYMHMCILSLCLAVEKIPVYRGNTHTGQAGAGSHASVYLVHTLHITVCGAAASFFS